jgi:hypothetical protein
LLDAQAFVFKDFVFCLKNLPLLDMPRAFSPFDPAASKKSLSTFFVEKCASKTAKTTPALH